MIKTSNGLTEHSKEELQAVKDYENTKEYKLMQIEELKQKLSETDYIACKIAEGAASREEYADELVKRQAIRVEINKLQEGL